MLAAADQAAIPEAASPALVQAEQVAAVMDRKLTGLLGQAEPLTRAAVGVAGQILLPLTGATEVLV